jgi:hypothetical protein
MVNGGFDLRCSECDALLGAVSTYSDEPGKGATNSLRSHVGRHAESHAKTLDTGTAQDVATVAAQTTGNWEDEGGTTAGHVPEFLSRHTEPHFDEFAR